MRTFFFYTILLLPFLSHSQDLSIQQLWNNLDKNLLYQQDELQMAIRKAELQEQKSNRIPVFYIDANLQRNLIIPTTPVPAIAFDPNAADGAIIPLKFSTKWSSRAGVQFEWSLFDPKRKSEELQKSLAIEQTQIDQAQNIQNWKRDATLAYTAVVLATHQYALAQADSAAYEHIRQIAKARYEAGRESLTTYLLAEQEVERKRINLYQAWSVLQEADLELRLYVDLGKTQTLSSDIGNIQEFVKNHHVQNLTVQSLEKDQQIIALQKTSIQKQRLPTIALNGYIGQQYFSNEFRLDRSEEWFGNSFINLVFRVPLSAYFTSQASLRKTELNYDLTAKKMEQQRLNDEVSGKQSNAKMIAAELKIKSYKKIEQLALQAKKEKEAAYHAGRILLSAYNESIAAHNKALQDVWQSEYDLIKIIMDRMI